MGPQQSIRSLHVASLWASGWVFLALLGTIHATGQSLEDLPMLREADLLTAIERDPTDALAWLALADCLEENGEDDRAELVRLREWLRFADLADPQRSPKETRLGELLVAGVRPSVPLRKFDLGRKATLTLALIPPGFFWMGCDEDEKGNQRDERPRHKVTLTRPFYIGITSITRRQWLALAAEHSEPGPKPDHPVQSALFAECKKYCQTLSKRLGESFRLPTEAEWEYACRAAVSAGVYLGDWSLLNKAAWHAENSREHTHGVGKKKPNAWGLYDTLGNIWDWCSDGERQYSAEPVTDPVGPVRGRRIVKGGAWRSSPTRCRPAARFAEDARRQTDDQGFRVVMDWA